MRRTINKNKTKAPNKGKTSKKTLFTFGNIAPSRGRVLVLLILIIFTMTFMFVSQMMSIDDNENQFIALPEPIRKVTALEKEIVEMVAGYPIEEMTPYILKQDPKTAMFLVAIAKKESAWGKRKPVLDGKDCFNYWGFRLKAERMGSGGHTCFDSPAHAVDAVAARIDEMVQSENIATPKDMIVWKCGYGCKDKPKSEGEKKWISDVDYYYSAMSKFL